MVQVQPRKEEICKHLRVTIETPEESCFRRKDHVSELQFKDAKFKDKYETDLP